MSVYKDEFVIRYECVSINISENVQLRDAFTPLPSRTVRKLSVCPLANVSVCSPAAPSEYSKVGLILQLSLVPRRRKVHVACACAKE